MDEKDGEAASAADPGRALQETETSGEVVRATENQAGAVTLGQGRATVAQQGDGCRRPETVDVAGLGALLVLALVVTPAAAAMRVASGPLSVPLLAAVFGVFSAVGGILLAVAGTLPVSPYITTISFVLYLVCRGIGARRDRATRSDA